MAPCFARLRPGDRAVQDNQKAQRAADRGDRRRRNAGDISERVQRGNPRFAWRRGRRCRGATELADAVLRIVRDKKLAKQLGQNARRRAAACFSADHAAAKLVRVYQSLLNA